MKNNQRYTFHPDLDRATFRLVIVTHGALTTAEGRRMVNDLGAALVNLSQLEVCDAIEILPCIGVNEVNGEVTDYMTASDMEAVTVSEAGDNIACWTVYGHLREGGSVALLDFPSQPEAENATAVLTAWLGKDVDA